MLVLIFTYTLLQSLTLPWTNRLLEFLISNFRLVLNIVCFLLSNSGYLYSNILKPTHSSYLSAYEDGTECSETSAYKILTPGNYPEESVQHSLLEHRFSVLNTEIPLILTDYYLLHFSIWNPFLNQEVFNNSTDLIYLQVRIITYVSICVRAC